MIKHIKVQNFRSFVEAEVDLQPFSLVVGANGSGKTNLLRFLSFVSEPVNVDYPERFADIWTRHAASTHLSHSFLLRGKGDFFLRGVSGNGSKNFLLEGELRTFGNSHIFNLNADEISKPEQVVPQAFVKFAGEGTTQVLEMLKSGDREDLFDAVEKAFKACIPEVEKLSLRTVANGEKQIQIREKGLPKPLPATELSEGTRIVLAILTIIHQENPPSMILLEDIDRGLHPRLFEYLAPLLRDIAVKHDINIVATTHNPYLVDAMQDHKDAVIIVEKKDGASTLSTLASRLEGLDYDKVDPDDMPLGQLWFSGLVGGVPKSLSSRPAK